VEPKLPIKVQVFSWLNLLTSSDISPRGAQGSNFFCCADQTVSLEPHDRRNSATGLVLDKALYGWRVWGSIYWIFRPACIKSSSIHHGICQSSLEPVIALVVGLASEAFASKN